MTRPYIITMADSTYCSNYPNSTTATNDYFSDWKRSFTMAGTGTTYNPYFQTYTTVPYQISSIVRQETYYDPYQEQYHQEHLPQEPVLPQIPQKSPEQIKEEAEATERAKNLLLEYLDDDNKQKFLDKKHLEITSKLFKDVKYHIPLSKLGRIKARKDNNVITELCLLVKEVEQLPTEDIVLTKLLHVMNDEMNMLKTASHSNIKENLLSELN